MTPAKKIISSAILIGVTLGTLLGGLALLVRALRTANLKLDLELKKDDTGREKLE